MRNVTVNLILGADLQRSGYKTAKGSTNAYDPLRFYRLAEVDAPLSQQNFD